MSKMELHIDEITNQKSIKQACAPALDFLLYILQLSGKKLHIHLNKELKTTNNRIDHHGGP